MSGICPQSLPINHVFHVRIRKLWQFQINFGDAISGNKIHSQGKTEILVLTISPCLFRNEGFCYLYLQFCRTADLYLRGDFKVLGRIYEIRQLVLNWICVGAPSSVCINVWHDMLSVDSSCAALGEVHQMMTNRVGKIGIAKPEGLFPMQCIDCKALTISHHVWDDRRLFDYFISGKVHSGNQQSRWRSCNNGDEKMDWRRSKRLHVHALSVKNRHPHIRTFFCDQNLRVWEEILEHLFLYSHGKLLTWPSNRGGSAPR